MADHSKKRRQKYDWPQIRFDFMLSDFSDVKPYFEHKYNIYNKNVALHTAGWAEEKKRNRRKIYDDMVVELQTEDGKNFLAGLHNVMSGFGMMIQNTEKLQKLTAKELFILWKVYMTMCGKPTNIDKVTHEVPEKDDIIILNEHEKKLAELFMSQTPHAQDSSSNHQESSQSTGAKE